MNLSILLVDDEPLASKRLRRLIIETLGSEKISIYECLSATSAIEVCKDQHIDIIFLDIEMPCESGLELGKKIASLSLARSIVFVTAHVEFAFSAYQIGAHDYLQKPVSRNRLRSCFRRVLDHLHDTRSNEMDDKSEKNLVIETPQGVRLISKERIVFLKAEQKYTTIYTEIGDFMIADSLTDLGERLGEDFVRVHRNCIVSTRHVSALRKCSISNSEDKSGWCIELDDPKHAPISVSRRQLREVRRRLSRVPPSYEY